MARAAAAARISDARQVLATARVSGQAAFLSARNAGEAALLSACSQGAGTVTQVASAAQKSLSAAYGNAKTRLPEEVGHTTDRALGAAAAAAAWLWAHFQMLALYFWAFLKLLWSP